MTDLREVNLIDLMRRYVLERDTAKARKMLNDFYHGDLKEADLIYTLRHHNEGTVTAEETWVRDSFDQLLMGYSILEIANLVSLIPNPLPRKVHEAILRDLSQSAVLRYYEKNYKLLLPRLLRLRLEGKVSIQEKTDSKAAALFMRFLDLRDYQEADAQLETILWLLDGGYRKVDLDDVLEAFKSQEAFFNHMTRKLTKQKLGKIKNPTDKDILTGANRRTWEEQLTFALLGLQKFFLFCREFEGLLDESSDYPKLRSAFWYAYSYWFSNLKYKVGNDLPRAVKYMSKWDKRALAPPKSGPGQPAVAQFDESENLESRPTADQMIATLKRLTSSEFKSPLRELAAIQGT